jgi:hypothetical protein
LVSAANDGNIGSVAAAPERGFFDEMTAGELTFQLEFKRGELCRV